MGSYIKIRLDHGRMWRSTGPSPSLSPWRANAESDVPSDTIPAGTGMNRLVADGFNERTFRRGDLKLQIVGLRLAVLGTLIWGYGDAALQYAFPF